ncbi:serine/threonine-protein kinase [Streptomyces peucetius]|uniref:Serine/threonine protein kinase n=1 Tax=Streptomyces peucetius TaxID=1950 RepID=A0ABY6IDB9_STRPE|nr:serine/threonine-protein kinase [Streptomyces peucetius]UYQ63715.1 serine/threonine protein kinase [Streptomyces peucetius]
MQPLDPGEPRRIGAYRLLGRLGAGGMGRVYLGRSAGGRTVAVKVVHPHFALDDEFRARFRREVEAARRVGGEWTAPVLDADPDAPVPWVATGYVAGPALSRVIAGQGPLPAASVRVLGFGLAGALTAVHALGLVHRDVKPSNVLLTLEGPRLIDFGIARATDGTASLTSTGVSVGSPGYMSPEQILGKGVTGAADVFSLGAVLAYAATGTAPFPGDSSAALLYKVVHEEPELASLEGELRELTAACLAKDPAARPAPGEVADRLAAGPAQSAGWLPGPVVEQISRAAVELLHLESAPPQAEPPVPGSPPPVPAPSGADPSAPGSGSGSAPAPGSGPVAAEPGASGPVAFSSPAVGVFGPPVGPGAPGEAPAPWAPPPVAPGAGPQPGPQPSGPSQPPGGTPGTPPQTPGSGFSFSGGGGRRISCTLALTVAGALAAVTVGAGVLLDTWRNADADKGDLGAQPPPSASASKSPPAAGGAEQVDEVPRAFVGTWSGPATEQRGIPHGTVTVTVTEGKEGEDVVRTTTSISVAKVTVECHGVGRLASGSTARTLRIEERTDPERPPQSLCTGGEALLELTLAGDTTLHYRSHEDAAGRPTATLTKTTG